jgi:integrase
VRLLRPCLKWAKKRGLVGEGDAVADIEPPCSVGKRDRVLSKDELRKIWPHLTGAHGDVMRWLLWTGCRLNEAARMRWGEIADDDWTIPGAHAKNGVKRTVPLPRQALQYLRLRRSTHQGDTPDPNTLVFPSRRGGVLSNWDRETKRIQKLWHGWVAPP